MASDEIIHLDGRTGEGGGQLVRIAIAPASVAGKPVKITNVRGNRPGPRGGGTQKTNPQAFLSSIIIITTKPES